VTPATEGLSGSENAGGDGEAGSAGMLQASAGASWNSPRARGRVQPRTLEDASAW